MIFSVELETVAGLA